MTLPAIPLIAEGKHNNPLLNKLPVGWASMRDAQRAPYFKPESYCLIFLEVNKVPFIVISPGTSLVAHTVKNLPTILENLGSIHRSGRSPGEGHGNPPQSSGLENPMDREAWWATVHRVAKSGT